MIMMWANSRALKLRPLQFRRLLLHGTHSGANGGRAPVNVCNRSKKMSRSLHTCVCRASRITRTGRVLDDVWSKKAKSAGYVARSAYKLLEIQEKYKLIPPGGRVLDLGCHPGAWLQVACGALGPPGRGGLVLGVDIQETKAPEKFCDGRVRIVQADARELPKHFWVDQCPQGFDAVLSDMCHFTHGNATLDAYKSLELAHTAYDVATGAGAEEADAVLRPGGSLVMKLLQGEGTQEFALEMKGAFQKVVWHRSKATRSESKEIFLLGLKRR